MKLELGREETAYEGEFIKLVKRTFTDKVSGKKGEWEYVRRKNEGRIVAVVGITPRHEVVLTKIFRIPLNNYIVELCAGLPDKSGEAETELAKREFLEETGYASDQIEFLTSGPYNSGLSPSEMAIYIAHNAAKIGEPELEPAEDIEVLLIPLTELENFLAKPPADVDVDLKLRLLAPLLHRVVARPEAGAKNSEEPNPS